MAAIVATYSELNCAWHGCAEAGRSKDLLPVPVPGPRLVGSGGGMVSGESAQSLPLPLPLPLVGLGGGGDRLEAGTV